MKKKLEQLFAEKEKIEEQIEKELDKLPNAGEECHCDDSEWYESVHHGNLFNEILWTCVECGGYKEVVEGG